MSKAQNSGKRAGSWGVLILLLLGAPACGAGEGQLRPWQDYRTIMWVGDAALKQPGKFPLFLERLREMGINTAMVFGDGDPGLLVSNRFPYYVENIVNRGLCLKFRSNVQDWDKFVTQWTRDGRPETALVRDHCLDDPQWRDWARKEASGIVRKNRGNQPLAYDLRDELSTTISANPFDYDFNPITLARFRIWLKQHHGTVEALNAAWETGVQIVGGGEALHDRPDQEPDGQRPGPATRPTRLAAAAGAEIRPADRPRIHHPLELLTLGRFPELHGFLAVRSIG